MEHIGRYFICKNHQSPNQYLKHVESIIQQSPLNIALVNGEAFDRSLPHVSEICAPQESIGKFVQRHDAVIFQTQEFANHLVVPILERYPNTYLITGHLPFHEMGKTDLDHVWDRVVYLPWSFSAQGFFDDSYYRDSYIDKPYVYDLLMFKQASHRDYVFDQVYNDSSLLSKTIMTYHAVAPEHSKKWDHLQPLGGKEWDQLTTSTSVAIGNCTYSATIPEKIYDQTHFSIITETVCEQNVYVITEKTSKVLASGRIGIWAAAWGFVNHLRDLGFDVFDDVVDHSYDLEQHGYNRLPKVIDAARSLAEHDPKKIFNHTQKRALNNRKLAQWYHHQQAKQAADDFANWFGQ